MLHGFLHNKITTPEEYLIGLEMQQGQPISIDHSILDTPIKFDNNEIDAFILDAVDSKLVIQLVLPLKEKFDDCSNVYKTSYIRKLLNSDSFLSRFNSEFVEHVKLTTVHTEDYTTEDKLWLLSHEEVGQDVNFLKKNNNCHQFDLFKHIDLQSYSNMLLNINKQNCCGWRLRSADSDAAKSDYSRFVGCVDYIGSVYSDAASGADNGALLPACAIG